MGGLTSNRPLLIHTFDGKALVIVCAFNELCKSEQICLDLEKVCSTETLVAGTAKKSQAIWAMVRKEELCTWSNKGASVWTSPQSTSLITFHHANGSSRSPRPPSNSKYCFTSARNQSCGEEAVDLWSFGGLWHHKCSPGILFDLLSLTVQLWDLRFPC